MFSLTVKNLIAHKARFLSTALAVLLGVAFVAGTLVFTDSLDASFSKVVTEANDGVDAVVRAPAGVELARGQSGAHLDATVVDEVRTVGGVAAASVQVQGYAQLVGPDGQPVGDQATTSSIGTNWVTVGELNPYELVAGHEPGAGEVVIDRSSAEEAGIGSGDVVTVLTAGSPAQYTVAGVATFGGADAPAGSRAVLFDTATAESVLSTPGQVDAVAVAAADGVSEEQLAASLRSALSDDVEVVTGDEVRAEERAAYDDEYGPFRTFMLVFAFVAVFVGAFIINNTFSITVAQRSKEMAMLRAIGASRRQVLRSVVVEAAVTGVVASLAGVVAGIGIAAGIRALMATLAVDLPSGSTVVAPASMIIAFAIGVVVTLVSALLPARRAGRVLPVAALRDVAVEPRGISVRRVVAGVAVTGLGVAALAVGLDGGALEMVGLGAFTTLIGVGVLGPVVVRPYARALGAVATVGGVPTEMAARNAARSPRRSARTASALMIGLALVVFITILSSSIKASLAGSLDHSFTGTHVVDSGVFDGQGGLSPRLAGDLAGTPGVDVVAEERITPVDVPGDGKPSLFAFTAASIGDVFDLGEVQGDVAGMGVDGIAVEADHAREQGWDLGTRIPAATVDGPAELTVVATYTGSSEWLGTAFVDIATADQLAPESLDSRVYVAGDGEAVASTAAGYPTADVLDRDGFYASASDEIDSILGVVYALLALAVLIALLGVANTVALSIVERTREVGLLRAVGMTRGQLRSTLAGEAVVIAGFGALGGLVVGSGFAWATVKALADQGFDTFSLPVGSLVTITAVAAVGAVLAAAVPARRASRLAVLDALSTS